MGHGERTEGQSASRTSASRTLWAMYHVNGGDQARANHPRFQAPVISSAHYETSRAVGAVTSCCVISDTGMPQFTRSELAHVANMRTELTAQGWRSTVKDVSGCKMLGNLRWLQPLQRQKLRFLPTFAFAMRRSGVRPSFAPPVNFNHLQPSFRLAVSLFWGI